VINKNVAVKIYNLSGDIRQGKTAVSTSTEIAGNYLSPYLFPCLRRYTTPELFSDELVVISMKFFEIDSTASCLPG